jgi:hypothetical protein
VPEHPNRFQARYIGQLWHTDLHHLNKVHSEDRQNYAIAFIDDKSWSVMYHEILADQSMPSAVKALRVAFAANLRPYQITIDNHENFVGSAFQNILAETETLQHRTHLYSPEENREIEIFWEKMEATIDYSESNSIIDDFTNEYHENWTHSALCRMEDGKRIEIVPAEVWRSEERWEGHSDLRMNYQ